MYFRFLVSSAFKYGVRKDPQVRSMGFVFTNGEKITKSILKPLIFEVDNTAENPPVHYTQMVIPVMSPELIQELNDAGVNNLQCYDAILINPETGEKWTDYKAVNIVGVIACADMKKSDSAHIGAGLYNFRQLVLNEKKISGSKFFRLSEDPSVIIISKSVCDYLYRNKESYLRGFMVRAAYITGSTPTPVIKKIKTILNRLF